MNYIVLNIELKDRLMVLVSELAEFIPEGNGINPIEIKSGEFILPLSVLEDTAFIKIKEKIIADGNESLITIREVGEEEFITETE